MRRALIAIDRRLRTVGFAWVFWPLFAGQLALIVVVLVTLFLPREAKLTVQASTRALSLHVTGTEVLDGWGRLLPQRAVSDAGSCRRPVVVLESQIAGPLDMAMQLTPAGELSVSMDAAKAQLGTVDCGGGPQPIGSSLILSWRVADATQLSLPFRGHLTLGGDVNTGTATHLLLLGGTVRVEASSAPFGEGQVTSETQLYHGDRLYLSNAADGDPAVAHGIMEVRQIDDGGARTMQVTAHATATQARVQHYGQTGFAGTSFAPTFWAKLQAQPEWALMVVIVAILLSMTTQLQTYLAEHGLARTPPTIGEDTA